ncbi:MAG: ribbon-helix-helix domain-containing protein [Planctomycetota bacterium]
MPKNLRAATLSVNLPMELAQAVYQQVRDGKFTSDDEVVRAALRQFLKVGEGESESPTGVSDAAGSDTGRRGGRRKRAESDG